LLKKTLFFFSSDRLNIPCWAVFVAKNYPDGAFAGGKVWKKQFLFYYYNTLCFYVFSGKAENYGARNLSIMGMAREERVAVRAG